MWKRRFLILKMGIFTKIQYALVIIVATAVLHNIAVQSNDDIPPENIALHEYLSGRRNRNINDVPVFNVNGDEPRNAVRFRNAVVEDHFVW